VVFASHSDMFHGLGDLTCSSGGRPVEPRLAFGCGVGFWTGGLSRELVTRDLPPRLCRSVSSSFLV